jgi:hypothetical protein
MPWKQADYADVRHQMQPGDVIAFSGKAHLPEFIKWATCSTVSHVGVIFQSRLLIEGERQHQIMESTLLNGFLGVITSRLDDRIESYEGSVWWLPLSETVRRKMDLEKFQTFLLQQEGKPYDVPQAIKSALDTQEDHPLLGQVTHNIEDFSKLFCSELVAAALEASGAISHLNASEVTPIDLCRFAIYKPDYYQLKGEKELIDGYNTLAPEGWGE